ncbi:1,2-phenylacetyl-CoA epoxidase subunit PaaC [Microbacterium rhizophilus]|uniref:1,2-phenylacetyl-CoA epoxidase subunit PaaC n=1 Tax=Microbacterium rhizophilus TaxID=3138934 RepID=UPI0031F03EBC
MTADTGVDHHGDVEVDAVDLVDELPGTGGTASPDVAEYALRLGDDALILSQQLGWWISRAPELEEDLALGNIALDLLGHARALLRLAGTASGRTEDDLAYTRDEPEFRCSWVVQQPNGDFADTIARQLVFSAYQVELYDALTGSADASLRAVAEKAVREVSYHRDHAVHWTLRLAGGTDDSRARLIRALTDLWPYVEELFTDDELFDRLGDAAPRPSSLRGGFDAAIDAVFAEAELQRPAVKPALARGRLGRHSMHLGYILAELQWLARRHPGATW